MPSQTPIPIPTYITNYLPIKFLFSEPQKLAQTFKVAKDIKVSDILLKGSYGAGKTIQLEIYPFEDEDNIASGSALATGNFNVNNIVKEKEFTITLNGPITLEADKSYIFIVESVDSKTEAGIGFAEADIEKSGEMYVYTRLVGGNGEILDDNHSWQPRNNQDVIYKLIETN